jgi:urease accessory protein
VSRRPLVGAIAAMLLASPSMALAHLVSSGLGPFYDGALHLLLSPTDLLGLIAVTLLAGLAGVAGGRWVVIILPLAWLAGGLAGLVLGAGIEMPWLAVLWLVALGGLVAFGLQLAPAVIGFGALVYGGLQGLLSGSAISALDAGLTSLSGIAATVLVVVLLGSAFVVSLRATWARVAVRVAGSWVGAVGMLMLGWTLKGAV